MSFGPGSVGAIAAGNVVGTAVVKVISDTKDFNIGNVLKEQFNGVDVQIAKWSGLLTGAAAAAGPLVGLVGGLGAAFGAAGAGVAAFGVLAKQQLAPVLAATKQVSKEQQNYNQALASGNTKAAQKALQQYEGTMLALPPAQREAVIGIVSMKQEMKNLSASIQPQTFGILNNGLGLINGLLPKIAPLAKAAGNALVGVSAQLKGAFTGPGFSEGLKQLTATTGPAIRSLSQSVGNIGVTLGKTFQAAIPILNTAEGVLQKLTGSLRAGAGGGGLEKFFVTLKPAIAELAPAITSIARALGSLLQGAVPLAQPLLKTIGVIGNALSNLFKGANFAGFVNNISSILTKLQPVFSVLGDNIGKILDAISGQLVAALPQIIPLITNLANAFGNIVAGLSPAFPAIAGLANAFVQLIPIVYPLITAFRQALVPIIVALTKAFTQSQPAIRAIIAALISVLPPISKIFVALTPLIPAIITAFVPAIKLAAQILNILAPVIEIIAKLLAKLAPIILPLIAVFLEFSGLGEVIAIFVVLGTAVKVLGPLFTWLWQHAIKPAIDGIKEVIIDAWHVIDAVWRVVWDGIKIYFQIWWKVVSTVVTTEIHIIQAIITAIWHAIDAAWRFVWDGIKFYFQLWWKVVSTIVTTEIQIVQTVISTVLGAIEKVWNAVWGGIKTATATVWGEILGGFHLVFGALGDAFRAVVAGIKNIWDGVADVFKAPVKITLSIVDTFDSVVNKVLGVIGVHTSLPTDLAKSIGWAHGGFVSGPGGPTDDKIPALLSNQEHVTNAASASANRSFLAWMDRNPGRALRLATGGAVASGTFSNSGSGNITPYGYGSGQQGSYGNAYTQVGGLIVSGVRQLAALGLEAAEAPVRAALNAISGAGLPVNMVKTGVNSTFDKINDWVKGAAKKGDDADAASAAQSAGNVGAGVSQWLPFVMQALTLEGLPTSLAGRVLNQIQLESGGNPSAINLWDSNAAKGQPSKGLLQTIDSTFEAYHWPGTSWNVYDAFANIAAAINYGAHRYGPDTLGMGFGHGYEHGTSFVPNTGPAFLHYGEMVIPKLAADQVRRMAAGGPVSSGFVSAFDNQTVLNYNAASSAAVTGINTGSVRAGFLAAYNKDIQQAFVNLVKNNQIVAQERATYANLVAAMKVGNITQAKADEAHLLSLEAAGRQYLANASALEAAAKAQQALAGSTAATANILKNQVAGAVAAAYAPAVASIGASITSSAQSGSGVADLFSYQAGYGATTAGQAIALLRSKIARTKTFVLNLKNLAAAGLDPTLIAQLAAAGEGAAGSITQQLLSDTSSISQLNTLEAQLNAIGTGGGAIVGNAAVAARSGGVTGAAGGTAVDPGNLLGLGTNAGGATLNIYGGVVVQSPTDIAKIGQQLYVAANATTRATGSSATTG